MASRERLASAGSRAPHAARAALRKPISTERKNLRYRDLGVHFVEWLLDISPNDAREVYPIGHSYAWNSEPGRNVNQQPTRRASDQARCIVRAGGLREMTPEAPASLENFGLLFMRLLRPFGKGWCPVGAAERHPARNRIEPSKRLVFSSDGG
jgi:hypothetical protein